MRREEALERVTISEKVWDIAVVGGGVTGVGIALDAASRGYDVCLFEQADFGSATSSRSTKIIHGGVRYLQQGNLMLVMEGLKERGILRTLAPHIVHDLEFVVPCYATWQKWFYGIGMKFYDLLAGKYGFGRSIILSRDEVLKRIPGLNPEHLKGGVLYHDGQFDDARLLIDLCETATEQGATLLNYAPVLRVTHDTSGNVQGLVFRDQESGGEHEVRARSVINAAGIFSDVVRKQENKEAQPMLVPSQGTHIILDQTFLGGQSAIMIPKTSDGRVMFGIPWYGKTLLGTTDTAIREVSLDPKPLDSEIDFILETASPYLIKKPTRSDILSAFAGIRPLVGVVTKGNTATISRDYVIHIEPSQLISIVGGKWTIYRKMAEDCVNRAMAIAHLSNTKSDTIHVPIHGARKSGEVHVEEGTYGTDAPHIVELIQEDARMSERFCDALPLRRADVVWSVHHEMARTLEDVLSRRTRSLLLNAHATQMIAPQVVELMATELGKDDSWQKCELESFAKVASRYTV